MPVKLITVNTCAPAAGQPSRDQKHQKNYQLRKWGTAAKTIANQPQKLKQAKRPTESLKATTPPRGLRESSKVCPVYSLGSRFSAARESERRACCEHKHKVIKFFFIRKHLILLHFWAAARPQTPRPPDPSEPHRPRVTSTLAPDDVAWTSSGCWRWVGGAGRTPMDEHGLLARPT